jgi:hypothetical protein
VEFGEVEASELRVKPNLPKLGPKLGAALKEVRERLQEGVFDELGDGRFQVDGHVLEADEVLVERVAARVGRSPATTVSPSRSTRRSTTSCSSKAVCTTASTRSTCSAARAGSTSPTASGSGSRTRI